MASPCESVPCGGRQGTSRELLALVAKYVGGRFPLPMNLEPSGHWNH